MFREGLYVTVGSAAFSLLAALASLLWARRLRAGAKNERQLDGGAGVAGSSVSPDFVDLDLGSAGFGTGGASAYDSRPLLSDGTR
jgi:hypothetical protein